MDSTRQKLLEEALVLFARHGFAGVSIAQVADRLGLTKQALLHHFGSKEKLYGEVLAQVSAELEGALDAALATEAPPQVQLHRVLSSLLGDEQVGRRNQLLMRELLDNPVRAGSARRWYLKSFLERLITLLRRTERWADRPNHDVLLAAYQLLGVVTYYSVSGPTLGGIFGPDMVQRMDAAFDDALAARIDEVLG